MTEVAIFSTSIDEPTYGPVAEKLAAFGYEPWIYRADKIASGQDELCITIDNKAGLRVSYNAEELDFPNIKAAWLRHPNILNLQIEDKAKELSIEREIISLQEVLYQQIPEAAWLNKPQNMKEAQVKLNQLSLAREVGFFVPSTVVSNNWDEVERAFNNDKFIVKMPKGVLYGATKTQVLYTTVIDECKFQEISKNKPFPAIYQEFLSKEREWRVTVVGGDVFEAAIYTADEAKDDWRKHQFTSRVVFKRESMPEAEINRCLEYLGRIGLSYGAFDFVEDREGKITFVECNCNGQFRWLEDVLGFPISEAIANLLIDKCISV